MAASSSADLVKLWAPLGSSEVLRSKPLSVCLRPPPFFTQIRILVPCPQPLCFRPSLPSGAGGVILFSRNFADPPQVAELAANLKREAGSRPLLVMVDQEGGRVQRLGPPFTAVPPARTVGAAGDPSAAEAAGSILGKELRAVNVDMDLAPVMDVDTNPANPVIGSRSFGTTPEVVSTMGYAVIRGLQQEGVAACAKHFPGHGDTEQDSHLSLPHVHHDRER